MACPTFSVPFAPSTKNSIGTCSMASTLPTSFARSATGPPFLPVHTATSASFCAAVALSSTYRRTFQFPLRMLPGMWHSATMLWPETSTPSTVPLSTCHPSVPSHTPVSGSSPTQHGHRMLQVQTSSRRPSSW
jgi:hypothetical protein